MIDTPVKTSGELRLLALLLLTLLVTGAAGCALPIMPGCSPGDSLPGDDAFLVVSTLATDLASSVFIDRTGRSRFSPDYTAWMLSTVAVCRAIPAEDLLALEKAWKQAARDHPGDPGCGNPEWPYSSTSRVPRRGRDPGECLGVTYHVDDKQRVVFSVKPGEAGQRPGLENAVGLTLAVLERIYGDRFVRELRAAGLQDLLREAP